MPPNRSSSTSTLSSFAKYSIDFTADSFSEKFAFEVCVELKPVGFTVPNVEVGPIRLEAFFFFFFFLRLNGADGPRRSELGLISEHRDQIVGRIVCPRHVHVAGCVPAVVQAEKLLSLLSSGISTKRRARTAV